MSRRINIIAACLLAGFQLNSFASGTIDSPIERRLDQAIPQIAVDTRSLDVLIDTDALSRLAAGKLVTVAIAGVGRFDYVIDQVVQDADVLEIAGHLAGDVSRKITLGLRAEGLTGLISTPGQMFALGYANRVQHFGAAGSDWLARELAAEPQAIVRRIPAAGEQPPVTGAQPVTVDLATLATMQAGDEIVMQLPGLGSTRVSYDETRPGDGSATWVGHLKDFGDNYTVLLTYSPGGTEGFILTPEGEINLTANGNGDLYLFNPTQLGYRNALGDGGSCAVEAVPPTPAAAGGASVAPEHTASGSTAAPFVDVMVYYTPGMVTAYGGADKVATRVDALIALANQAYVAGGLTPRLRRVGLELLNVADTTTNSGLLDQMRLRSGPFTGMNARRDQLGADLVSVVRPFYKTAQGNNCGIAYVSGSGGTNVSQYESYALAVISDGVDHAGTSYYCDNLTLAHELGHNMGLMHDRATVASQGGGTGAQPYAFGYAVAGRWGTIMSYTFPHQVKFSNPKDYTCNGTERCGLPTTDPNSADNVTALGLTMPLVAAFRASSAATATYSITGIVSLNGQPANGAVIKVSNLTGASAGQVTCLPSGTNGAFSCSGPAGAAFTLTPSYPAAPAGTTIAWTPASAAIGSLAGNRVVNFSGKANGPIATYQVAGTVMIGGQAAAGVSFKVTVPAGIDASRVSCSTTTATGSYACKAPAGFSFTITPQAAGLPTGTTVAWTPANASFSAIGGNQTKNFSGTKTVPQYTISIGVTVNGVKTTSVPIMLTVGQGNDVTRISCAAVATTKTVDCRMPAGYAVVVKPVLNASVVPPGKTASMTPASMATTSLSGNLAFNFTVTVK
jgi:hypothetical protein